MARTKTLSNYTNFIKGKSSDFNALYAPDNSARTLLNVDITLDGKAGRRLGLEPETNFNFPVDHDDTGWEIGYTQEELANLQVSMGKWENVDKVPQLSFQVLRIGNTLRFYDESSGVLSDSHIKTIDISAYTTSDIAPSDVLTMTAIKGVLVCAGTYYNPFYVKYSTTNFVWSTSEIDLRIRDFEGVDDGLEVDERPIELTNKHKYNLQNQGWNSYFDNNTLDGWINIVENRRKLNLFKEEQGAWPSNSDSEYLGTTVNTSNGSYDWSSELIVNASVGNTQVSKGHYTISPFNPVARGSASGLSNLYDPVPEYRPKAVATFAGRVWYGSFDGTLYYSQIVDSELSLGRCYQQQDPTAEDLNELIDTDGGTLKILDVGEVLALVTMNDALVVLGTGGVWSISGGDTGFTANNQLVQNLSKVNVLGSMSPVSTGSQVYFWSEEGIFLIQPDFAVVSVSLNRIQKDYNKIPASAKANAQGMYDRKDNKIYWCFSYHTQDDTDIPNRYTDVLVYSVTLNAFWDYRLSNDGNTDSAVDYPIMAGMFNTASSKYVSSEAVVTALVAGAPADDQTGILTGPNTSDSNIDGYLSGNTFVDFDANTDLDVNSADSSTLLYLGDAKVAYMRDNGSIRVSEDGGTSFGAPMAVSGLTISGEIAGASERNAAYSSTLNVGVICTGQGNAVTTDRGATWTYYALDSTADLSYIFNGGASYLAPFVMWDASNSRFLAIPRVMTTTDYPMAYSTDGINWTTFDSDVTPSGEDFDILDFAISNSRSTICLTLRTNAIDDISRIYATANGGGSWSTVFDGTRLAVGHIARSEAQDVFVATIFGTGVGTYTSVSGFTWSAYTASTVTPSYGVGVLVSRPIASENEECFIRFSGGGAYLSTNGVTWTRSAVVPGNFLLGAYVDVETQDGDDYEENVTEDSENVTTSSAGRATYADAASKVLMFLVDDTGGYRPTFGQYSSRAFHDWDSLTSEDITSNVNSSESFPVEPVVSGNYTSVIESLPDTLGEPSLQKQGTYIMTYYDYLRGGYGELQVPEEFDT
jgi:hypothetical protein